MDYLGQWGKGALDTPGPLNGSEYADLQVPYVNIQGWTTYKSYSAYIL